VPVYTGLSSFIPITVPELFKPKEEFSEMRNNEAREEAKR
jgi:hypothetical protein